MTFRKKFCIHLLIIYFGTINSLKYITIPFQVQKFDYKEDQNGLLHELFN